MRQPDKRLLKSYVWYNDQCFFVSTIERDSDIMACSEMRHVETIAWKYDWEKQEKGEQVGMTGHNWNALLIHQEMVKQLFETGVWQQD